MKLLDILAGTRAIKRVQCPLVNVPGPLSADQPEMAAQRARDVAAQPGQAPPEASPTLPEVGLRVLTGEETAIVYEKALKAAQKRGCETADLSDPIYTLMLSVYTLAVACVMPDSDPDEPTLAFGDTIDDAAENILKSPHLGRDGIAYLFEQHETWQDMCHPQALRIDSDQLWQRIAEAAVDDPSFFLRMRPALRWSCMRSMACLLVASQLDKSQPSSSSSPASSSAPKAKPKARK